MILDNMKDGAVAEKELLSDILAGADRKITIAQVDAALKDQGLSPDRRMAVKNDLQRLGLLVPPGQEVQHFAALRAEATKGHAKVAHISNVQAGGSMSHVGAPRRVAPVGNPHVAFYGNIPRMSDLQATRRVNTVNAAGDVLLEPRLNWLLRQRGITRLEGHGGRLTADQQERALGFGITPMERREIQLLIEANDIQAVA